MPGRVHQLTRVWPASEAHQAVVPRNGLVAEAPVTPDEVGSDGDRPAAARFVQAEGPFAEYERAVTRAGGDTRDVIRYRLVVPWFGWLLAWPVRAALRHREPGTGRQPPWAPPDRVTQAQVMTLGLLAAASMSAAFVNTLFTQTANFAAKEFGISASGQGDAGVIVRFGVVLALPFAFAADRVGRRTVIVVLAWAAPLMAAIGALAPNFWVLTASQTIARPLGLALDLLIAVVAAEAMARNSRAWAASVMAMASGLGAGIAVMSLRFADFGVGGWRIVYVISLVWLLVAADLTRRLPETDRFETARARRAEVADRAAGRAEDVTERSASRRRTRQRLMVIGSVAFFANLFIAPASFLQNRYLDDVRGYTGGGIALFTIATATPAGIGFVIGGRLADVRGRRVVVAFALPAATAMLVLSFLVGGPLMWVAAFLGGLLGGVAFPALAVYRTEMFPTVRRGRAGAIVTTLALVGGSIGIKVAGVLVDRGWGYGPTMALLGLGQVLAAAMAVLWYPETAHRQLEELNPEDASTAGEPAREPLRD